MSAAFPPAGKQSISRETTFERDLHARTDRETLSGILTTLCARLADDLKRKGYVSRTISIKLRYDDFQIVSRNVTLCRWPTPTPSCRPRANA
jgi:DNA polymerase-4